LKSFPALKRPEQEVQKTDAEVELFLLHTLVTFLLCAAGD